MPRLFRVMLLLCLAAPAAPADDTPLPPDVAAMHPDGAWKIRMRDFYVYLVDYYSGHPSATVVLPDYMRQRMVEAESRARKIQVTRRELDAWIDNLARTIERETGGMQTLEKQLQSNDMSMPEFRRRSRVAILRERVARAVMCERDRTRDREKELPEKDVVFVIDTMWQKAQKTLDRSKLPPQIVARIGDVEITVYEYGRELASALPLVEKSRAIRGLILVQEVNLLLGNDDPPKADELAAQKDRFMTFQRNQLTQLARKQGVQQRITDELIAQFVAKRGLSLDQIFANPTFAAQARARAHFARTLDDDALRAYFTENPGRFGDQLRVARILVAARGQRQVKQAGKRIRNLQEGKALADALWIRVSGGADFAELVRKHSDDIDRIKINGGELPIWLRAGTSGYESTWIHANQLEKGAIAKPFFAAGRGFLIVKLLDRRKGLGFEESRNEIREAASNAAYHAWRVGAERAARKSDRLTRGSAR